MPSELMHMGTLVRPHGIKGEICMEWYADFPVQRGAELWLVCGKAAPRPVKVVDVRQHKGRPLLSLEQVTDRTAAEQLRGCDVYMARAALPPPADDEIYVEDLLGCAVLLPDGQRIGRLDHVEYPADQEVWSIMTDAGKEILFPAQPCFIVGFTAHPAADAAASAAGQGGVSVTIDPPLGLLDVYLTDSPSAPPDDGQEDGLPDGQTPGQAAGRRRASPHASFRSGPRTDEERGKGRGKARGKGASPAGAATGK